MKRPRAAPILVVIVCAVLYILSFPTTVGSELSVLKHWSTPVDARLAPDYEGETFPIKIDDYATYFAVDGRIYRRQTVESGIALNEDLFVRFPAPGEAVTVSTRSGDEVWVEDVTGLPFFRSGRLFFIGPNNASITEWSDRVLWSREFGSLVTTVDAGEEIVAVGLLNGQVEVIMNDGRHQHTFSAGGSRLPLVTGVAIAPGDLRVAVLAGAEPQYLFLLERMDDGFVPILQRRLDHEFRRPSLVTFVRDGRFIVYETPDGITVFDPSDRTENRHAMTGELVSIHEGKDSMIVIAARYGERISLTAVVLPDRVVFETSFDAAAFDLVVRGDSLFIGADKNVYRVDFDAR